MRSYLASVSFLDRFIVSGGRSLIRRRVGAIHRVSGMGSSCASIVRRGTSVHRTISSLRGRFKGVKRVSERFASMVANIADMSSSTVRSVHSLGRDSTGIRARFTRVRGVCSRFRTHFSRVRTAVRGVINVTGRAGLLTLGTSVRTTHTNRRKGKFTIITSRIAGLSVNVGRLINSMGGDVRNLRADSRGLARSLLSMRSTLSTSHARVSAARGVFSRVGSSISNMRGIRHNVGRIIRGYDKRISRLQRSVRTRRAHCTRIRSSVSNLGDLVARGKFVCRSVSGVVRRTSPLVRGVGARLGGWVSLFPVFYPRPYTPRNSLPSPRRLFTLP